MSFDVMRYFYYIVSYVKLTKLIIYVGEFVWLDVGTFVFSFYNNVRFNLTMFA